MFHDDDAVTPVVGTVLILLITVAGMGAILAWGVPAVQGIQDQSNLAAIQGEFSDVRLDTLQLSIVDTARTAFIGLEDGQLDLENGSRFAILALHEDTFPGGGNSPDCDMRITGWSTPGSDQLEISSSKFCGDIQDTPVGVLSGDDLEVQLDKLVGSSVQSRPGITVVASNSNATITSSGDDLSQGDWRIRLVDADDAVHIQAFILGTKRIAWHLDSSVNDIDLYVEGGALFQVDDPFIYNLASARINEDIFVTGDYLMEFPAYTGDLAAVTAPSDPQVFLQLQGSHGRVIGLDTEWLRFDIAGNLAEGWCNHLVFRTDSITAGTYSEDADATCQDGDADGVRSVVYEPTSSPFPFELIHKRVYAAVSA